MTVLQKERISSLREHGKSYREIAISLSLSINTIKSFCRNNGITVPKDKENSTEPQFCPICGKVLKRVKGKKSKRFCSDKCRMTYWNKHQNELIHKRAKEVVCPTCNKAFSTSINSSRKFCSHSCYITYRFGGANDRWEFHKRKVISYTKSNP